MSYRVVLWGTGNVGYWALRHLIRHPDMELVGLHAHSAAKVGRDAGDIAGLDERTGIIASNDVEALLALRPDAVVYTASGELRPNEAVADMARILEAGINVVGTSLIYMIYPPHAEPRLSAPLARACERGGSTLFVNGMDPGFSGDTLPLAALQLSDQIEEVRVQEICDYSTYQDPDFTGMTFGFGQGPEAQPMIALPGMLASGWGGMIHMIAEAMGVQIDELREVYERGYADKDFECPMMPVAKGQCSAVRFEVQGIVNGRPLIVAEHVNRLGADQAPDWPQPPAGKAGVHRCLITGNPSVQLDCTIRGEDGDHNTGGVQASALRVINAIPAVCAHAPGLISSLNLPHVPSRHVKVR